MVLNLLGLESLRIASILLQPVIPNLSDVILTKLGVTNRQWSDSQVFAWSSEMKYTFSKEKVILFRRISSN